MENRPKMPQKYRSARPLVHGGSNRLTDVNLSVARKRWGALKPQSIQNLKTHSQEFGFSIIAGDLILLNNGWYVTHTGLIRLARRKRCAGIDVKPVAEFSSTTACRWAFRATVFKSAKCHGFVGYGDADPSNVSPGPCARPMASGSARSRRSGRFPNRLRCLGSRRSSRPSR